MSETPITVNAKTAAQMLSISMPTFYELAALDGFPAIRVGTKYLVNVSALQKWADENCGKSLLV